jgi:hypothetical protein
LTTPALGEGDLRDEGGGDNHDGGDCKAFENLHVNSFTWQVVDPR